MQLKASQPLSWCLVVFCTAWLEPWVFQFLITFFFCFFALFVVWIDNVTSSQSSSIVEPCFFFCPFLFFTILSGISNFRPYFWTYMIWFGSRFNLCQSSFWMFLFQQSELCESFSQNLTNVYEYPDLYEYIFGEELRETFPRIWQVSGRINIPTVINTFFLQDVQIKVSRPCHINVFHWIKECFFLRHVGGKRSGWGCLGRSGPVQNGAVTQLAGCPRGGARRVGAPKGGRVEPRKCGSRREGARKVGPEGWWGP